MADEPELAIVERLERNSYTTPTGELRQDRADAAAIIKELMETLERIKSITMRGDMSLGGRVACIQSIAHTALLSHAGAKQ